MLIIKPNIFIFSCINQSSYYLSCNSNLILNQFLPIKNTYTSENGNFQDIKLNIFLKN